MPLTLGVNSFLFFGYFTSVKHLGLCPTLVIQILKSHIILVKLLAVKANNICISFFQRVSRNPKMVRDLQKREEDPSAVTIFYFLLLFKSCFFKVNVKIFVLFECYTTNRRRTLQQQKIFFSLILKGRLLLQRLSTSHQWSTPARTLSVRTWSWGSWWVSTARTGLSASCLSPCAFRFAFQSKL